MAVEALAPGPTGQATSTSQILVAIAKGFTHIAIVIIMSTLIYHFLMVVIKRGRSSNVFSSQNISEEERTERRRRALQRFGGGGAKKHDNVDRDHSARGQRSVEEDGGKGMLLLHRPSAQEQKSHTQVLSVGGNNDMQSGTHQSLGQGAISNSAVASAVRGLAASTSAAGLDPSGHGSAEGTATAVANDGRTSLPITAASEDNVTKVVAGDICDDTFAQAKAEPTAAPGADRNVVSVDAKSTEKVTTPVWQAVNRKNDIVATTGAEVDVTEAEAEAEERSKKAGEDMARISNKAKVTQGNIVDEVRLSEGKRHRQPPPAQLLCEVLTVVCGTEVTIKSSCEGWIRKKKQAVGAPKFSNTVPIRLLSKIVLPLTGHPKNTSRKEGWTWLEQSFQSVVLSSSVDANPFRAILLEQYKKGTGLVTTAVSWHGKTHGSAAHNAIETAIQVFGSSKGDNGHVNKEGLDRCMSIMAKYLSKVLALWLDKDISDFSLHELEDESSDEEDLFSDYSASNAHTLTRIATACHSSTENTALGELLDLCGRPNATSLLSKRLLSDIIAQSSNGPQLAKGILQRTLDRLPAPNGALSDNTAFDSISKELGTLSHLIANSSEVAMCLTEKLRREASDPSPLNDGKRFECSLILWRLLSLGGYSVPYVGFENGIDQRTVAFRNSRGQYNSPAVNGYRFYDALKTADQFPLSYYGYPKPIDPTLTKVIDEAQTIMGQARSQACGVLRNCMRKKSGNGKDTVFRWLGYLVNANEMQANLLQEQLLNERDDVHDSLSSRPFLLGAAFTVLEICCNDLCCTYEKNGVGAFDARYLLGDNGARLVSSDERRMVGLGGNSSNKADGRIPLNFSGATELFFITSALLRVSVFPAIRIRDEYLQKYKRTIEELSRLAKSSDNSNATLYESHKRIAAGHMGWNACLDYRDLILRVVEFSILQLRFLADLSGSDEAEALLSLIPESMVKLPAQYIAHVALRFQQHLSPSQAEVAVQYATVLLGSKVKLSIQVQTELMRISGAFIGAGVQREVTRQKRRNRTGRRKASGDEDDSVINRRDLDIYTSLDRNDHGVVVFASPVASQQLGPALINMFVAMDSVEGVDVERENRFYKNMVQGEVIELILRLWCHPSGEFKRSITSMGSGVLSNFFRSVAASISIESDTVYQTVLDIRDVLEHHARGRPFGRQATLRLASSYDRLPSFLGALRRLLLLLVYLSQDEQIAATLGGCHEENDDSYASFDLGKMIVSLLDKFTAFDGGTSPQVDFRVALKHAANMASDKTVVPAQIKDLLYARTFATAEFGFDVSVIAHLLLALGARWTVAADKQRSQEGPNVLIKSITSHNDFDINHFQSVCDRLIVATQNIAVAADDQNLVAQADGYVDSSIWFQYQTPTGIALEHSIRQRKQSVVQDQLTHVAIDGIASVKKIKSFIDDLGKELDVRGGNRQISIALGDREALEIEKQLLQGQSLSYEEYTKHLEHWVVSSDSFYSESTGGMDHFYSSNASTRSNPSLGRVLLKDARSCWKNLPSPHPNASIFVCYAEERMDICKGLIVGAVGTPYSMGLFLFDICYPQLYPSAAPMLHFMTTGCGQVRFHANLYNDGKVCLSLLGTTGARDESQRWNPNESSLAQVLLSIQSQILDDAEPYFAEGGGHGGLQGTIAGRKGSARYNNTLRLSTLRHAIIGPLKSPPKGYEAVTRRHFAMCRKRLMVQAKVWMLESRGTSLHGRFKKAYSELVVLLSSDKLACEEWELMDAGGDMFGSLPPLSGDLWALQRLDQNLHKIFRSALSEGCSSQSTEVKQDVNEIEQINKTMFARALELSLQGGG